MKNPKHFSEVAKTYSANVANLDLARSEFENESDQFSNLVQKTIERLIEHYNTNRDTKNSFRFGDPIDRSKQKDGPWLNFVSRKLVSIDARKPDRKVFSNQVASLFFEIAFDHETTKEFVFRCRFENENSFSQDMDEIIFEKIRARAESFPGAFHTKNDMTTIYSVPLSDSLFEGMNALLHDAIEITYIAFIERLTMLKSEFEAQEAQVQAAPNQADEEAA